MTILAATPDALGLPSLPATTPPDPKIMKAAQDFEAMAIGQMLEPMFDTVDTAKGLLGGGTAEETFKPMLITEMAKQVEQRGGLGLANGIYAQMLKMQEKHR
ncbi:MAG: rod-binding protein [Janthinobacterium lividum]